MAAVACGTPGSPEPTATGTAGESLVPPTPDPAATMVTRAEVLRSLSTQVILPGYANAAETLQQLSQEVEDLCADPGIERLETVRAGWRMAREAWLSTESYRFGPAMDRRSLSLVDWWPIDTAKIDENLGGGVAITGERVREYLASTQRGLGTAEYLLFGAGSATLADVSGGEARCEYLRSVVGVVGDELAGVLSDWDGSNGSARYAAYFDGSGSLSLLDSEAEAMAVRSLVFQVRTIADMRLGAALGIDGMADASAIPAGDADSTREDLISQLDSIATVYRGAVGGLGLSARVESVSEETNARMLAAIDAAIATARNLNGSVIAQLEANPSQVRTAYDSMKELQRILNTEVVSVLGVSVGFADTDGDS